MRNYSVTEKEIRQLVRTFYARIREHSILGPIFLREVDDWCEHEDRLCDFWSSVLLASGRYKGNPLRVHRTVGGIEDLHFDLWLDLFATTAGEVLRPPAAVAIVSKATAMATHLRGDLRSLSEAA